MSDRPILQIGDQRFEGWTGVQVERALDSLAGSFSFGMTERWPEQPEKWVIESGAPCEVFLGGEPLMRGWVDEGNYSLSADDHPIDISGREVTCDLVDCSAIHKSGSWNGQTLEKIAAELVSPFGISVAASATPGAAFGKFALQQGESVFDALDRMCRMRGVLPMTTPAGQLRFDRPGRARATYGLEVGVNAITARRRTSARDRFSQYLIKGQAAGADVSGSAARPTAKASDQGVTRHRPMLIVNSEQSTQASLEERARWEATVRAGRSEEVQVEVRGWRADNGALFALGELVPVRAPVLGVDDELLVKALRHSDGDQGMRTLITLCPPEAFSLLTLPEPKPKTKAKAVGR